MLVCFRKWAVLSFACLLVTSALASPANADFYFSDSPSVGCLRVESTSGCTSSLERFVDICIGHPDAISISSTINQDAGRGMTGSSFEPPPSTQTALLPESRFPLPELIVSLVQFYLVFDPPPLASAMMDPPRFDS